ncbi:DMT family transporter [Sphingomonas bacterium]|uniref:DMT family transporter n=1 Tax=Sphingomonas bacterium TaxID=1895847 RepID=UPI001575EBBA|nr:DMT family transporter [Sphingomonas bacterium]
MSLVEIAAALLVALLWGVQFVTSKVGIAAIPPLLFVALRFAAVAVLLLPFAGRPSRREVGVAALVSVFFGGLGFGLFFAGLRLSPAGLSAVVAQLMTPFTVLLAWPIIGERPTTRVVVGLGVAFAGVALALASTGSVASSVGILLVAGAAAAQGLGNVLVKRLGPLPPFRLMAWLSLFAAPQLGLASAVLEHGQGAALATAGPLAWLSLAYAVLFGAVAGFALWFWLVARLSLARIAPFALLQTVFAIVAGVVVLHEPITLPLVAGALVCVAGVALTQLRTASVPRPAALCSDLSERPV